MSDKPTATVHLSDPRVTRVSDWLLGLIGTGLVATGIWMAASINELNLTIARMTVQYEVMGKRLDAKDTRDDLQDARIGELRGDVSTLEGKTFRGVQGYEKGALRGN